ncbi:carbohydrate kinase family protein [Bradyrhizobium sp. AZCC 2230]|uniref:carbohydrate kinase family protein n=1 Tax=Bradyrhizobium sp. AZCC 2230 TaxID=3117021 RepID=UPI002FF36EC3
MSDQPHDLGNRTQPTIDDVARAAGVSKGTVSHVIGGRVSVTAATRARVDKAIAALNYRPAETARSLTARKRQPEPNLRIDASVPRLTTVGYVSVDYTACLDRLPEREERRLANEIVKSIGGPAANVAAIAAGLGQPFPVAASIITSIGLDQDSDWAAAELSSRRVDLIIPRERRSGRLNRALVLVEADGRRTIVNEPSLLNDVDVQRFVETTDPQTTRWWLHLEGYQVPPQIAAAAEARAKGFRTSMQATGLPPEWLQGHADEVFRSFDLVVLHRETLALLPSIPGNVRANLADLAAKARAAGPNGPEVMIVTLGADGAAAVTRDGAIIEAPALSVNVVDTTGAGDSFVGSFLAAWLNDCPLPKALNLACAAGSLQVTCFGAQELRPSASDLIRLVDEANVSAHAII